MVLRGVWIDGVKYFVNPLQIEAAGSIENAAKVEHEKANPKPLEKPKKIQGEKPEEK